MILVIAKKKIQTLMAEIYKVKNNLNPPVMDFMFERGNKTYNRINFQEFATKILKSCTNGSAIMVNFS